MSREANVKYWCVNDFYGLRNQKSVVFGDITLAFGASQFASVAIISVSSDEAATDSGRLVSGHERSPSPTAKSHPGVIS
jgi:hypothetical protein